MITQEEQLLASKLYALLYNGANIYNAPRGRKKWGPSTYPDAVQRFGMIIRELQQHMKEIQNG